ncbi:P-loop containing nucleoside triphosphate hydrolase protein [Linderina pennispora]|uniref:p-loop containing nucleoside triphosphate hydrolase protein n=1 Tax=Linderina pennispora TaxID=61395 RepID=A0A1Y1WMT9_9FUNG|nr:P-loop containing nucleoside triphosphate hydrolase protein [Linderina pennispora]ORX74833.1 P-loop containing nucleoside triphosphate hydrolase protein [Linderina pennispora]
MPPLGSAKYIRQATKGLLPLDSCVSALQAIGVLTDFDILLQSDVLSQTPAALHPHIKQLRMIVLDHFASAGATALELQPRLKEPAISSGVAALDSLLLGGLPMGHIMELCGKSGVGKSGLAISFAAHHLLLPEATDNTRRVYYIHTSTLSVWRIQKTLQARLRDLGKKTTGSALQEAMERVTTVECTTIDALLTFLYGFVDMRSTADAESHGSHDLLVIDSIRPLLVSALQKDMDVDVHIHAVGAALRQLCRMIHPPCAALIVNGVSVREQPDGTVSVRPSLGTSWGQVSHTHLLLDQGDMQNADNRRHEGASNCAKVAIHRCWSAHIAHTTTID